VSPTDGAAYRLGDLAERIGAKVHGDAELLLRGVATLADAGPDELSFLTNPRYRKAAETTRAGAVLVGPGISLPGRTLLEAAEPYVALAEVLELLHGVPDRGPGVSPDARVAETARLGADVDLAAFAVVGEGAELGDRVRLAPGAVVGDGCRVGDDTRVGARAVLYPGTHVGRRCILHAGVVLGSDGFGFATRGGEHRKVPQIGRVVVEDDVEIGANSTVDRAGVGETRIGRGTKIDNLVMVAHGVQIGPHSLLVAQAGVAGSTRVGERFTIAGQSGVAGHLEIGDDVSVGAKSAVLEDVPSRSVVTGVPAMDHRAWRRAQSIARKLPELRSKLREMERRIERLERGDDRGD
jgi:UDP-3-O-[3-hydroxymyristoyl] glucosamine N-acyltransferase